MFNAEQEHLDHEAGRLNNEFEAAYAVSRATTDIRNDTNKIRKFIAAGLFVAVVDHAVYCRFTDAMLGQSVTIKGVATTREAALRLLGCEEWNDGCDGAYVAGRQA